MKIPKTCIVIETNKFPILDGEEEELVNEGMYGKALCIYLENALPQVGIKVPFYCCEDWGWWVEINTEDINMGLRVYSAPTFFGQKKDPEKYAIISSIENEKKWSWSKFRNVDVSDIVQRVMDAVDTICSEDYEIKSVTRLADYPF